MSYPSQVACRIEFDVDHAAAAHAPQLLAPAVALPLQYKQADTSVKDEHVLLSLRHAGQDLRMTLKGQGRCVFCGNP